MEMQQLVAPHHVFMYICTYINVYMFCNLSGIKELTNFRFDVQPYVV